MELNDPKKIDFPLHNKIPQNLPKSTKQTQIIQKIKH